MFFKPLFTDMTKSSLSNTFFLTSILFITLMQGDCNAESSSSDLSQSSSPDLVKSRSFRPKVQPMLEATPSDVEKTSSSPDVKQPSSCYSKVQPMVEIKGGYFFFSDAKMRKIYNRGGLDVQISGSYPIWRWLQIYGSVEYLQKEGKSLHGNQKTSIWEIPVSVGLRPVITIYSKMQYYFTLGPRYFYVHQHNHSLFVKKNVNHSGIGWFANTGFMFFPYHHLIIDIFGEYSYERVHIHSFKNNVYGRSIQVGGFSFGAGLGYAF